MIAEEVGGRGWRTAAQETGTDSGRRISIHVGSRLCRSVLWCLNIAGCVCSCHLDGSVAAAVPEGSAAIVGGSS